VIRAGFLTTEFWITLITQALALLALSGVITGNDATLLSDAMSKCIAAGGVFLANAWVVVRYIQSRTHLKQLRATNSM
jgi:hypothetical protein